METGTIKRAFDIVVAALGLSLTSPLMVVVALSIKSETEGNALFGHERIGRHGRAFKTWKFRTMVERASEQGPEITTGGDRRVTRVGKVLRLTKLDEVPQLINVLAGEMSIVGPRPEVREYVEMFAEDYRVILQVRPGITDEASIEFRNEEEVLAEAEDPAREYAEVVLPRKIELAKEYVREGSFGKDLSTIARTVWKVVRP